jgi:hypothetical protein
MAKAILELSKMPKSCRECPFYKITDICDILSAWNNYMPVLIPSEGKHPDCPLKEVEEEVEGKKKESEIQCLKQ